MKIPKLTDVSATLDDLQRRRYDLLGQAQSLRTDLLALARSPDNDHPTGPASATDVAELLGRVPPPGRTSRVEKTSEMNRRIVTIETAAGVLAVEIEAEINRASAIIRERVKPEFDRRLRAVALALVEAQKANIELDVLLSEMETQGVRGFSSMSPLDLGLLGGARNRHGNANIFLREAARAGVLRERELTDGARL